MTLNVSQPSVSLSTFYTVNLYVAHIGATVVVINFSCGTSFFECRLHRSM
jgi:hypothetical protein